jgi:hypothetical protein
MEQSSPIPFFSSHKNVEHGDGKAAWCIPGGIITWRALSEEEEASLFPIVPLCLLRFPNDTRSTQYKNNIVALIHKLPEPCAPVLESSILAIDRLDPK